MGTVRTKPAAPPSSARCTRLAKQAKHPSPMGQPLELPHVHRTNWKPNQTFTCEDDPDRTKEPWCAPSFVREKDPALQRKKIVVQDLGLVGAFGNRAAKSDSFARIVHGVLDEEDCAALLKHVNEKEARDGHRIIVDSPDLSTWLLEVLRPHLPPKRKGKELAHLNERCRFLCYTPGQYFEPSKRPAGHPNAGDGSEIIVQLYLHDASKKKWRGNYFPLQQPPKIFSLPTECWIRSLVLSRLPRRFNS